MLGRRDGDTRSLWARRWLDPFCDSLLQGEWRIVRRMAIPEFIKTLRAKIGTELLQVPTVSVLTYDNQGRILLVQDKSSGLWGPPGGIVDPHELPSDAAVYVELT